MTPNTRTHQRSSSADLTSRLASLPERLLPDEAPPRDRDRPWFWAVIVVVLAVVVGVVWIAVRADSTQSALDVTTGQRDAAVGQSVDLAAEVQKACGTGQLAPTDRLCAQAAEVRAEPIPGVPVQGPIGERGPAPTMDEIRAVVVQYFAENPPPAGRTPTPAEVAAVVAGFLTSNPPASGRPPTVDEIAASVQDYFASNPPRQGPVGERGPGPTVDEIRAAVEGYLAEHPPPSGPIGPMGDQGAQGIGVNDVRLEQLGDTCQFVFDLFNPADGTTTTRAVPVPCSPPPAVLPGDPEPTG